MTTQINTINKTQRTREEFTKEMTQPETDLKVQNDQLFTSKDCISKLNQNADYLKFNNSGKNNTSLFSTKIVELRTMFIKLIKRILNHNKPKYQANINYAFIHPVIIEEQQAKHKLTYIRWILRAIGFTILCFAMIGFVDNDTFSSILVSLGTGTITGLVLFFLSNKRNNQCTQLEEEIDALNKISTTFEQIFNLCLKTTVFSNPKGSFNDCIATNYIHNTEEILSLLQELKYNYHALPFSITSTILMGKFEQFNGLYIKYNELLKKCDNEAERKAWIIQINDELIEISKPIQLSLREKEHQIRYMKHSCF